MDFESIAVLVHERIREAVGSESVSAVAERTGLEPGRISQILSGAVPDSFEVMTFEAAYACAIWPR